MHQATVIKQSHVTKWEVAEHMLQACAGTLVI